MCLPSVTVITAEKIDLHMGHMYHKAYYDAKQNTIYINSIYGVSFWTLLHEMGHWALCLLPHVPFVYRLNVLYDKLDVILNR